MNNKSTSYLDKIRSPYILQNIFSIVRNFKRKLEIVRYNKNMQKRLGVDITQYKMFATIEIELIPAKNKYGKFININNQEENQYFHIYFNDSNEEINRNYLLENEKIDKIIIIIDFKVTSFYELFSYCECIESISFTNFYRKNINNMSFMFYKCTSLTKINFSNYITMNVENMSCMFYECSLLKELDLSNFNTDNVTDMSNMFYQCNKLEKLDMTNFNTENVKNMKEMFFGCSALRDINMTKFNTASVNNISQMFKNCSDALKMEMKFLSGKSKYFNENVKYHSDNV